MTNYLEKAMEQGKDREEEELDPGLLNWPAGRWSRREEAGEKTARAKGSAAEKEEVKPSAPATLERWAPEGGEGEALSPTLAAPLAKGLRRYRFGTAASPEKAGSGEWQGSGPESAAPAEAVLFGGTERDAPAEEPAGGLYQALRRGMRQAAYARRGSGAVTVRAPETPAPAGMNVEELDRAVERDARRYDGGFGLY